MKLKRPTPPKIGSIGRRESDTFLIYDMFFASFGEQPNESAFLRELANSTKVSDKHIKEFSTSELLGSELLRQLYKLSDPLSLIVTGHLFIESFLNHIIEKKFRYSYLILENRDFTFNLKLEIIKSKNYLDDYVYFDIKTFNQLRNKFAHNLLYNIAEFDMSQFYYFDQAYNLVPFKSKKAKRALNTYILRMALHELLIRLTKAHPTIGQLTFNK